jgi:hypothetical protein
MIVQSNGSYPFSNPFGPSAYSPPPSYKEIKQSGEIDQLKNDYSLISHELKPAERKLYNTLLNEQNYDAAKGLVTVGFMRAAGIYHDENGDTLPADSLVDELGSLYPPDAAEDQKALASLQSYLIENPSAMSLNQERRGSLLDLKA